MLKPLNFQHFKSLQDWMASESPLHLLRVRIANGWLRDHLPEVHALYGVPQSPQWHPEIDTGVHVELALQQITLLTTDPATRFAVLAHDLGKGLTPAATLPQHINHEAAGLPLVDRVCDRFEVPASWRELARLVCEYHSHVHGALEMSNRGVVRFFREAGLYARPELLEPLLLACLADKRGRAGSEDAPYPQAEFLRQAFRLTAALADGDDNRQNQLRVAAVGRLRREDLADRAVSG